MHFPQLGPDLYCFYKKCSFEPPCLYVDISQQASDTTTDWLKTTGCTTSDSSNPCFRTRMGPPQPLRPRRPARRLSSSSRRRLTSRSWRSNSSGGIGRRGGGGSCRMMMTAVSHSRNLHLVCLSLDKLIWKNVMHFR